MLTIARRGNASRLQATRVSITPIDAIGDAFPTARGTHVSYTGQRSNVLRRFSSTSEKTGGGDTTETAPPWLTELGTWIWLLASLFALLLIRFTMDRRQIHTTSSLHTQRERALYTFPYDVAYWSGKTPWFSGFLYYYWYDRPYLIRVTGHLNNDWTHRTVRTVWRPLELETMAYWEQRDPVISDPQYPQWVWEVKKRAFESQTTRSFVPFIIREIRDAPMLKDTTNRLLEKLDYNRACEALSTRIEKDFDMEYGVSIDVYYEKGLYRLLPGRNTK